MTYEVLTVSDLYEAGRQEDGVPYISERYFAELTNENGRRWRHNFAVSGAINLGYDEYGEGPFFADNRKEAEAKVENLVARIAAHLAKGGSINFDHWYEVRPAFGSDEYIAQGIDYQDWVIERNEARAGHPY
jgi:hypothetical protein